MFSAVAYADPEPGLVVNAGVGFGRYTEQNGDRTFESNVQPALQVGAVARLPVGDGALLLEATAGLGLETDMQGTQLGQVIQQNSFRQELYELSPRVRWPLGPELDVEGGYRLTVQRLFFLGVPGVGDALETVVVHALEAGVGWHREPIGGGGYRIAATVGLNRGTPDNDRIEGEHFASGGHSFRLTVERRWPSRFALDGLLSVRTEDGDGPETVMFQGMPTMAMWPQNTTWMMTAIGAYSW
jgi:hypothetical protein